MTPGITSPQQTQINRLVEEVVAALGLSKEAVQRILAQGGIFKEKLKPILEELSSDLPAEMTLGGVTYDIFGFLKGGEMSTSDEVMTLRAKEMKAHMGKGERTHLLKYQEEIPVVLRGKFFVFTDDRRAEGICIVCWHNNRWVETWGWLGHGWHKGYKVLRRK